MLDPSITSTYVRAQKRKGKYKRQIGETGEELCQLNQRFGRGS